MDTTTLIIVGVLAIVVVAAALYALNRSWGDFPSRLGPRAPLGSSAPGMSAAPAAPWNTAPEQAPGPPVDEPGEPDEWSDGGEPVGRVPITHDLVRRSAAEALRRGGPATRYIVRDGDQLYFDFSQIDDPARRRRAYTLMRRFNAGEDVDLREMMRLMRELFSA
ncbi:MAG: hypothetical protein IPO81_17790 [Kouleothrix sp.]|nr:hypothetical protein [Kouleothrix sp.]